jgi:hypothetical protein
VRGTGHSAGPRLADELGCTELAQGSGMGSSGSSGIALLVLGSSPRLVAGAPRPQFPAEFDVQRKLQDPRAMQAFSWGTGGTAAWVLCALTALSALGCSSSSDSKSCATGSTPTQYQISNLSPAVGSSVANTGTALSFTIVGELVDLSPSFSPTAAHTAGAGMPNPLTWTLAPSGKDSVYTSEPITWAVAPAHVELSVAGEFQTADGCLSEFPSPLFSYDITAAP